MSFKYGLAHRLVREDMLCLVPSRMAARKGSAMTSVAFALTIMWRLWQRPRWLKEMLVSSTFLLRSARKAGKNWRKGRCIRPSEGQETELFFLSDGFAGTIDMALSLLGKMVVCTFYCTKV